MSWSELDRLVETAELDDAIRRALGHCRSLPELVLASRRLGFAIESTDLMQARALERGEPLPLDRLTLDRSGVPEAARRQRASDGQESTSPSPPAAEAPARPDTTPATATVIPPLAS